MAKTLWSFGHPECNRVKQLGPGLWIFLEHNIAEALDVMIHPETGAIQQKEKKRKKNTKTTLS